MPTTRATTRNKIQILRADPFAGLSWLRHGFSTRRGGVSKCYGGNSLNLGRTEDDTRGAVERNRKLFFL
ncbi:MAG TPA: laccase domain-containing protein, partial [Terriglobales bacterium]